MASTRRRSVPLLTVLARRSNPSTSMVSTPLSDQRDASDVWRDYGQRGDPGGHGVLHSRAQGNVATQVVTLPAKSVTTSVKK